MDLSVAIPDSCLGDEAAQQDKTRKASVVARACAAFRARDVLVYADGGPARDRRLLSAVLRYAETPPYLRRALYPRSAELRYAGAVSPLKIPSHTVPAGWRDVRAGDVREGVVAAGRGGPRVDVGVGRAVPYRGAARPGGRVTVRMRGAFPDASAEDAGGGPPGAYWGYRARERGALPGLLAGWGGPVILTSRKGRPVTAADLRYYAGCGAPVLAVFGSTQRGVHDMLGGGVRRVQNSRVLNFFPGQGTETVRVEEALLGALAILRAGL